MNRSAFDVFFCFLSIFLTFDSKLYFLILYTNSSACLLHLNITQIFAIRVRTHNSWCPNAERVSSSWSWWKETPYCARSRISNLTVLPWALSNMFEEIGLQVALVLKRITWYQHPKKSSAQKKAKAYSIYYDFWCEYVPIFYQQKNAPRHPTCLFRREGACQPPLALVTSTQKQPPPAGHSRIFHRKVQQQHSKCVFRGFQHLAKFGGSPWFYWDKKKFRPNLISEDSHLFYQLHVLDGSSKLRCQNLNGPRVLQTQPASARYEQCKFNMHQAHHQGNLPRAINETTKKNMFLGKKREDQQSLRTVSPVSYMPHAHNGWENRRGGPHTNLNIPNE